MKNKDEDDGFVKGVAYCIALVNRENGEGEFILNESGLTMKDFNNAKVDECDLKEIRILSGIKKKKHPAQGMRCNDCKKIIGTSSSCKNCILLNKSNRTHLSHCFQGQYETTCKYGEDDTCPANPELKNDALTEKDEVIENE